MERDVFVELQVSFVAWAIIKTVKQISISLYGGMEMFDHLSFLITIYILAQYTIIITAQTININNNTKQIILIITQTN